MALVLGGSIVLEWAVSRLAYAERKRTNSGRRWTEEGAERCIWSVHNATVLRTGTWPPAALLKEVGPEASPHSSLPIMGMPEDLHRGIICSECLTDSPSGDIHQSVHADQSRTNRDETELCSGVQLDPDLVVVEADGGQKFFHRAAALLQERFVDVRLSQKLSNQNSNQ
ncbi:hypothetical protein BKA67DRAFT_535957 [Truncatella angustata]|uniref:Uncharacterized protein n=1 Tax=Truncatella angustata TaxID=152316 RepID=A0A9P8UM85_9PEZI|nr:uncharacterized protein BKA67DRAFT_535957 [Truncatella angustata]KAH6654646.1 hypothetical protein BKA67DRAFT_535957 [Truncatella angustata]